MNASSDGERRCYTERMEMVVLVIIALVVAVVAIDAIARLDERRRRPVQNAPDEANASAPKIIVDLSRRQ